MSELYLCSIIAYTIIDSVKLMAKLANIEQSKESIIRLIFKRCDVCVETKESGIKDKKYPEVVKKGWNGKNRVLYYKIPPGLNLEKVTNCIPTMNDYFQKEVHFKYLENRRKAHFSLTILSGNLLDRIECNVEEMLKTIKSKGKGLWIPIGYSRKGLELINLADDNSAHILQGGSTGGGKSTLMRLIMVILHMLHTPQELNLWLMDLKQGNEIKMVGRNPLLVTKKCDKKEEAESFLSELWNEVLRRYELFQEYDVTSIAEYNEIAEKRMPRIILIIDEYNKLEGKPFDNTRLLTKHITGDGRSAGVHVYLSTHRPTANLVDGTLKNNFPVVVAFRCNPISARVLLGEDEWKMAMRIDPEISGRALLSYTNQVLVQVPFLSIVDTKVIMAKYQKPSLQSASGNKSIIKTA